MNCVKRIIKSPIFYVFYMILIVVILGSIEYSFKKSDIDKYMKEKDNQILKTKDSVLLEENDDIELDEPFTLPANLKKIDNISIEIVDNKLKEDGKLVYKLSNNMKEQIYISRESLYIVSEKSVRPFKDMYKSKALIKPGDKVELTIDTLKSLSIPYKDGQLKKIIYEGNGKNPKPIGYIEINY